MNRGIIKLNMKLNELNAEEKRVIEGRGTEAPFVGSFLRKKSERPWMQMVAEQRSLVQLAVVT